MLPETLAARTGAERKFWLPLSYGSAGWALSLAATLVVGFGLMFSDAFLNDGVSERLALAFQPLPGGGEVAWSWRF